MDYDLKRIHKFVTEMPKETQEYRNDESVETVQ